MDVIDKMFNKMVTQDQMDYELFDLTGTNYCPVDGTITLKEFVDDDNAINFYSFVKKINVRRKFVKNHGQRAAVDFEIHFEEPSSTKGEPAVLELIWFIEISKEQKITKIDSYWDVENFRVNLEKNHPNLIKNFFRHEGGK